jgi:hypothetical protein
MGAAWSRDGPDRIARFAAPVQKVAALGVGGRSGIPDFQLFSRGL